MIVRVHKNFEKQYKKLKKTEKDKFKERINIFITDEFNPILNNHPLRGKYLGYRSINVTGDLRAIYKREENLTIFVAVNSHSNLYR
ncbi:MAG: type II toxin-antitoxin system mRNA interferase toxin, RelE/StbE family [Patescibacteria group bacterium]|nr:type II toxin-antitoxin system mRNA interferase toxin, RelE/StbE family [Patescibacteria group bacterium]